MKLEAFAKAQGFSLEFIKTVKTVHVGRGKPVKKETCWVSDLKSQSCGDTLHIQGRGRMNCLFSIEDSTRKKVRERLIKKIRGMTIRYGFHLDYKVKVPANLQ